MKILKKKKIVGFTFFIAIIFSLHIFNFHNLKTTNSMIQLNGDDDSSVIIKNSQNVDIFPNKKGDFFVLSTDNNSTKISFLDKNSIESNKNVTSTQLNLKYLDAEIINDDIYLLAINDENKRQIIRLSFSDDAFQDEQNVYFQFPDESLINSFCLVSDTLFFVENGRLFGFINDESSGAVELLSEVNSIFLDYSGNYLYVVKENNFVDFCSLDDLKDNILTESSPTFNPITLNDEINLSNNPVNSLSDRLFMSSTGVFFEIDTNANPSNISKKLTLDVSEINIFNCSTIFNFESKDYLLCKTSTNKASLFDIEDNLTKKYNIELGDNMNIFNICSSSDNTLLTYKDSDNKYFAKLISEDDLIEETEEKDPTQNNPEDPENPQNPTEEGNNNKLLGEYETDEKNKYVLGVKLGTTVSVFKQNLNLNGEYTVTFKNYAGKDITSGKLGTGSVVSFWKDGKIFKEYTIVVDFDVTGEGNFNSRDLDYMYNHIFNNGKTSLTGEYFCSGDMDNDGKIDTLDLLKMRKSLN